MKIAIGFFGITRSLRWTLDSIKEKIISPLANLGELELFSSLVYQSEISNVRSGENEILYPEDYKLLNCRVNVLHKPAECLDKLNYEKILKNGDAWGDNGKSLSNLLHQLTTLQGLVEPINLFNPDLIILVRPDLLYHDNFSTSCVDQINRSGHTIQLPNWQWARGVNDRFAICGNESFQAYANRVDLIEEFLSGNNGPLHAEKFLWWSLNKCRIKIIPTSLRGSRTRANGFTVNENFKEISLYKKIRRFYINSIHSRDFNYGYQWLGQESPSSNTLTE